MNILRTDLDGVLVLEPKVFSDDRGFFLETYHRIKYRGLGITVEFVQDNLSFSHKGWLKGCIINTHMVRQSWFRCWRAMFST